MRSWVQISIKSFICTASQKIFTQPWEPEPMDKLSSEKNCPVSCLHFSEPRYEQHLHKPVALTNTHQLARNSSCFGAKHGATNPNFGGEEFKTSSKHLVKHWELPGLRQILRKQTMYNFQVFWNSPWFFLVQKKDGRNMQESYNPRYKAIQW